MTVGNEEFFGKCPFLLFRFANVFVEICLLSFKKAKKKKTYYLISMDMWSLSVKAAVKLWITKYTSTKKKNHNQNNYLVFFYDFIYSESVSFFGLVSWLAKTVLLVFFLSFFIVSLLSLSLARSLSFSFSTLILMFKFCELQQFQSTVKSTPHGWIITGHSSVCFARSASSDYTFAHGDMHHHCAQHAHNN